MNTYPVTVAVPSWTWTRANWLSIRAFERHAMKLVGGEVGSGGKKGPAIRLTFQILPLTGVPRATVAESGSRKTRNIIWLISIYRRSRPSRCHWWRRDENATRFSPFFSRALCTNRPAPRYVHIGIGNDKIYQFKYLSLVEIFASLNHKTNHYCLHSFEIYPLLNERLIFISVCGKNKHQQYYSRIANVVLLLIYYNTEEC